jgi:hypothetical protein
VSRRNVRFDMEEQHPTIGRCASLLVHGTCCTLPVSTHLQYRTDNANKRYVTDYRYSEVTPCRCPENSCRRICDGATCMHNVDIRHHHLTDSNPTRLSANKCIVIQVQGYGRRCFPERPHDFLGVLPTRSFPRGIAVAHFAWA